MLAFILDPLNIYILIVFVTLSNYKQIASIIYTSQASLVLTLIASLKQPAILVHDMATAAPIYVMPRTQTIQYKNRFKKLLKYHTASFDLFHVLPAIQLPY